MDILHSTTLPVLVQPGLHGSGDAHWQTLWERRHPGWQRIEQQDWSVADLDVWADRLQLAIRGSSAPVLIVAHSFGCLVTAHLGEIFPACIAAALLVAPANPEIFGIADRMPQEPLGFPAHVVASRNDPWMPLHLAHDWALRWNAEFIDIGEAGHINAESGFGEWPRGLQLLRQLARCAVAPVSTAETGYNPAGTVRFRTSGYVDAAGGIRTTTHPD